MWALSPGRGDTLWGRTFTIALLQMRKLRPKGHHRDLRRQAQQFCHFGKATWSPQWALGSRDGRRSRRGSEPRSSTSPTPGGLASAHTGPGIPRIRVFPNSASVLPPALGKRWLADLSQASVYKIISFLCPQPPLVTIILPGSPELWAHGKCDFTLQGFSAVIKWHWRKEKNISVHPGTKGTSTHDSQPRVRASGPQRVQQRPTSDLRYPRTLGGL